MELELVNWQGKKRSFQLYRVRDLDTLLAQVETDEDIPFWAELWPAAEGLALWLEARPELVQGKRALELGCGLGLVGLVAAANGAEVVQTDFVPAALELAGRNARANGLEQLTWQLLDWRQHRKLGEFQLILGSDLFYEPGLHEDLLATLELNLAPSGHCLFSDPGREGAQAFVRLLEQRGWQIEKTKVEKIDIIQARRGDHENSYPGE